MKPYACPICNFDSIHQVHCSHCGQAVCRDCLNACFETNGAGQDNRNVTMKCPTCKEPTFRYTDPSEQTRSPPMLSRNEARASLSAHPREHPAEELRDMPPSHASPRVKQASMTKQQVTRMATFNGTNKAEEQKSTKPTLVWFQSAVIGNVWWPATLYSSHISAHPFMKQDDFCSPFENEIMKQYILEVSGFPCKPVVCLFGHPEHADSMNSASQFHNNAPTWWYPVHSDALTQPFTLANLGDFFAEAPAKYRELLQRIMSSQVVPLLTDDSMTSHRTDPKATRAAPCNSISSIFRKPSPLQIEIDDGEEELLIDRLPAKPKGSHQDVVESKSQKSYQEVTEWLSKLNVSRRTSDEDELLRRANKTKKGSHRSSPLGPNIEEAKRMSSSRIPTYNHEVIGNGSPRKDSIPVKSTRR